jgi:hypothetical protein
MRRVAWQPMKIMDRYRPLAAGVFNVNNRIQCRQGDAHVRRMRRDTVIRSAQNCVDPIESPDCIASHAGRSLIAACGLVIKVIAAGSLYQIPARCRHVANLPGRAKQNHL